MVIYDVENEERKKREVRALLRGSKQLNRNLWIITEDYEGEEQIEWFGIKRKVRLNKIN